MDDFLIADGRVLFMGEQESFGAPENAYLDTALAALGSSLALGASELDTSGLQDSIVGQILLHPYNVGVSVLNYGNVNTVTGVPAGGGLDGQLFLAMDLSSVWGAVEDLPTGGIVILVADVNLLSNSEDEAGNDNHVFFLNIAPDPVVEVPMLGPAAIVLVGLLAGSGMRLARGAR